MSRFAPSMLASVLLLTVTGAPALGLAAELPLSGPEVKLAPTTPAADEPQTLSTDDLAEMSGGQAVKINEALSHQELSATSEHNTVYGNVNSGQVTFAPGSLSDFNGFGNVVINTGANNIVQGSINVTIATTVPGL